VTDRRERLARVASSLAFLIVIVLWGGFLASRHLAGRDSGFDRVENLLADWRFSLTGQRMPPPDVVVAAIDEDTIREAGAYPLPRATLARAILAIGALEPRGIAIDILFAGGTDPTADQALADAVSATKASAAAAAVFVAQSAWAGEMPSPASIVGPLPTIAAVARLGLVNLTTDQSGIARHAPLLFRPGDKIVPSFVLTAVNPAGARAVFRDDKVRIGDTETDLDLGFHLAIRHYGPSGTIPSFSLSQALAGTLDAGTVRGRIVVIGSVALGSGDTFSTPYDRIVPGVEVLATAIANLVAGDGLRRTRAIRRFDAAVTIVLPAICLLLASARRGERGLVFAGLLVMVWLAAVTLAFSRGYWLDAADPIAVLVPCLGLYPVVRVMLERSSASRAALRVEVLARFQSPSLVRQLADDPAFLEAPVARDVAVVFIDLSGFTGVAERLGPARSRDMLATFHSRVDEVVSAYLGFVVSFMGDGAMILFGMPSAKVDDAARALRCVAALRESVEAWRQGLAPEARERLEARIGAHFGSAVLSRLGSSHYQHVTATGDTVNVASRLLDAARQQPAGVAISDTLWEAAGGLGPGKAAPPFELWIRGRSEPLRVRGWEPCDSTTDQRKR
jgi:adenylate cyclase